MIWGYSISLSQFLQNNYKTVSIRFQGDGITQKMLDKLIENEIEKESPLPEVTAWDKKKEIEISSKSENKTVKINLYEVYGNAETLCPMKLVAGTLLLPDDKYGCVIDEGTAYHLFGTKYVDGVEIILEDKTYTVRGVVKNEETMLIIQSRDLEHKYSNLEIAYEDVENGADLAESLLIQNNINDSYSILEGGFYSKVSSYLILFPGWILLLLMMKNYICNLYGIIRFKLYKKNETKGVDFGYIIYVCVWLISLGILCWIVKFKLYLPDRLIPSRWSDLDFWGSQMEEFKGFLTRVKYIEPFPRDILLLQTLKHCVAAVFLTCISVLTLNAHKRILLNSFSSWITPTILVVVFSILAFGIHFISGTMFSIPKYYPGIVVAYLIFIFSSKYCTAAEWK